MTEYFDVLIIGAGLSGIGAAYHLQKNCPNKSYAILEGREAMGGTWDLFRYPGIRSDSDMYTLGYNFKPWEEAKDIADGPSILNYVRETAVENGIDKQIRYGHLVQSAAWSSDDAAWTIEATNKGSGETTYLCCNMLLMCAGYYSYKGGYTPEFEGRERFDGQIIHPQKWPEDLDYKDKNVVVIGSGATAVTLVPAMSDQVKHITMLQRSPTYMASRPDEDVKAKWLRRILPSMWAYRIIRWKNVLYGQMVYKKTRTDPDSVKEMLFDLVREELGPDYDPADFEKHFTPSYNPWDQRLCLVPNGDLFQAIKSGKASVVTDHIDTFTEDGILLQSGEKLDADIIVTATGLNMIVLGGIEFTVDDRPISFPDTFTYKGMMYSGVPNMISTFGYINASWTLRSDLTAEYICRLINHMDAKDVNQCTPTLRTEDQSMTKRPYVDDFSSGYMQRVMHLFPKQGDYAPWIAPQDYRVDKKMIRRSPIEDGVMVFEKANANITEALIGEPIAAD